ncbi:hypothetical protein HBH56_211930 [Parastagonospora nodorum]|uniref:N-acetyltransferase domain-containing protein n=2 Tax=Phaeosphaeria nodorum (strain SN15 / ATCC MYA-4574 / FGSC 10173) TaxID=321614 RepID=A0A7U2NPU3_PHANO|nr:hypothetical protein SNOG_13452 [Parastagonospora nodorum SN15]KAH3906000.1 hypothetical protein HBH56_211930 [Parastagonospora nodorum]EAT79336.1 hypothetical protein SNOG_13452 [Parastagonospora nodorum SN15]KAH3931294.1 hypothetical protein HBH54_100540 [Parastagonospora nodorum]KAH3962798.1 hypothetical protein HBH52_222880 [Parastagonospora nodorum]KAH4128225.1 hypothetical protein HBH45_213930 [Parastagonospora nodorum]
MPVRLATAQDEPAIGAICHAAFFNEGLFGQLVHPHRHQYPSDPLIFWRQRTRAFFQEPRDVVIVSTLIENGEEKIAGMATWQRQGDDAGAQKVISAWQDPGPDAFEPLDSENRAIDKSKATILQDTYPWFKHHWEGVTNGLPRANNWYLNLCGIDPAYQKRGVGQQLVAWGLERAKEENVHSSVVSSEGNAKFYLRCGYDEIVGNCSEGENNPMAREGVKGGEILWKWAFVKEGSGEREGGEVPEKELIAVVPS